MTKDLRAARGRYYIRRLIEEGEHEHQDFKFAVSDARKIARSLSAFANNDGGLLLVGVKDNGVIAGIRTEEDLFVIEDAAGRLCTPAVDVRFDAFATDPGVTVVRVTVPKAPKRPVFVDEGPGRGLTAYYRVADENIVAHPLMVRVWQSDAPCAMTGDTLLVAKAIAGSPRPLAPEDVAPAVHLSQKTAFDTVVQLATAGLVRFVYDGKRFVLQATAPDAAGGHTGAI